MRSLIKLNLPQNLYQKHMIILWLWVILGKKENTAIYAISTEVIKLHNLKIFSAAEDTHYIQLWFPSLTLKIPNWEHQITFPLVNFRNWREINKTCCSPLMVFGDYFRMEWWIAEETAQQEGEMSSTGNRGSTRLMILAVIICRCEWSEINHLGARSKWQEVRNGDDQTGGSVHELHTIFTEVEHQDEVRQKNAGMHSLH